MDVDTKAPEASPTTPANMSTTESTYSEDETDWDGISSLGSGIERMSIEADAGEGMGDEGSFFRRHITAAQLSIVHRLMGEFWAIFEQQWQSGTRQHGATESSSSSGLSSLEITGTGQETAAISATNRSKRPRNDEEGDSENEKDRPSKRAGKHPASEDQSEIALRFACPFRKRNPRKYCVQAWSRCALTPHATVARVKYASFPATPTMVSLLMVNLEHTSMPTIPSTSANDASTSLIPKRNWTPTSKVRIRAKRPMPQNPLTE
jgi:hypothetical protein